MERCLALPPSPASTVRERSGSPGHRQLGSPSPEHQSPSEGPRRLPGEKALPCLRPGITAGWRAPQPSCPGEGWRGDKADDPLTWKRRAVSRPHLQEDWQMDAPGHRVPKKQMEHPGCQGPSTHGEGVLRAGSAPGSHVNGRQPEAPVRAQRHTRTHAARAARAPSGSVRPARGLPHPGPSETPPCGDIHEHHSSGL